MASVLRARSLLLAGLLLSLATFLSALNTGADRVQVQLRSAAQERATALQSELDSIAELLAAFAAFFAASNLVEPEEFDTFAAGLDWRRPGLENLGWAPRVSARERDAYERGESPYAAREIRAMGTEDQWQRAADAPEHYPLTLAADPLPGVPLGFDMSSEPQRKATIERALQTGQLAISPALDLGRIAGIERPRRHLAILPVKTAAEAGTRNPRDGVLAAVLDLRAMTDAVVSHHTVAGQDVYLVDLGTDREGPQLIHFRPSRDRERAIVPLSLEQLAASDSVAIRLSVAGREWVLHSVAIRPVLLSALWPALRLATIVLLGFAIAASFALGIERLRRRARHQRERDTQTIAELRQTDAVTGLPNRSRLIAQIDAASGEHRAVLVINLRRFHRITEMLDYDGGDQVLLAVARRIVATVPLRHFVARLPGDEFVVLCRNDDARRAHLERLALKLRRAIKEPLEIDQHWLRLDCVVAAAIARETDPLKSQDILARAALAMRLARGRGSEQAVVFDGDAGTDRLRRQLSMEGELREAIRKREVEVRFQPQFRTADLGLHGFEALVRWECLGETVTPPAIFHLAEEAGLLDALEDLILDEALALARRWRELRPSASGRVAVNMSADQFLRRDFVSRLLRQLQQSGLPGTCLEIELTESTLIEDIARTRESLGELRQAGVDCALDDFGTGFSALNHLRLLPVQWLKIDRSFVADLGTDQGNTAIVRATVEMARAMAVYTLAEGVESTAQLEQLRALGCDAVQGFLFSPAVPGERALRFLDGYRMTSATAVHSQAG